MTGTIKALALAASLGAAGTAAVGASGPLQRLHQIHHDFEAMQLSADQKREVHQILRAHREEASASAERFWQARLAVGDAVRQAPVDESLIRERVAQASSAAAELAILHARVHAQVREVLSPKQNAQAEKIHAEIREGVDDIRQRIHSFVDARLDAE
jgi:Spy/CpxP family protein refolding chaperone